MYFDRLGLTESQPLEADTSEGDDFESQACPESTDTGDRPEDEDDDFFGGIVIPLPSDDEED